MAAADDDATDPPGDLIAYLASFEHDPWGFVMYCFPWGTGELSTHYGPEPWQKDVLERLGKNLTPSQAVQEAIASGHGVGKSCLVSWIILWAMTTAPDTRGVVTANTETQLKTKTWAELAKWHRLFIFRDLFTLEATRLFSIEKRRENTWRVDMVPWSERNPEAFAGLHNQGKRCFVIYDEASSIPDLIYETTEGFLTDEATERLWLICGNPTRSTGRFHDAFNDRRWHTTQVDAREVSFTNKRQIEAWAESYGDDSDFFRVRVKGMFPRVGSQEFIPSYLVMEARGRSVDTRVFDPCVLGVDIARFGDDETVLVVRKGRDARTVPATRLRGFDLMSIAARIVEVAQAYQCDAVFVDGTGLGGGVVDRCRQLRLDVIDINFGQKPGNFDPVTRSEKYANKRAEMWGSMRAWLATGAIEDVDELQSQLVGPSYGFNNRDEIQIERKDDMRKRGVPSPDWADALALTFAWPVVPNIDAGGPGPHRPVHEDDYDPFDPKNWGVLAPA